jgi:hypothetical protein
MTENTSSIDDREANIQQTVLHIINAKQDEMFEQFDRLHRRGIHDDDVVAALRHFGEIDLLDQYAEWGDIDIREDDNTTTNPIVPDPMDADGNRQLAELHEQRTHAGHVQTALEAIKAQLLVERDKDLYFDPDYGGDGEEAMVDGPVNLLDLAEAVVKGLGK